MKHKNTYGTRYRRRHEKMNPEHQQEKAAIMTDIGPHVRPKIPGDGADLSGAVLSGRKGLFAYAQVSFIGHGERGRMLTAIRRKEGDAPELSCGCFDGNTKSLREYIANGAERYRKTRTLALDTVLMLLDARNDEVKSRSPPSARS